jgi:hypothetical protein
MLLRAIGSMNTNRNILFFPEADDDLALALV